VLQNELKGRSKKIALVGFDLLYLNGYDLRKLPLFERKATLKKIIAETDIQFSESFESTVKNVSAGRTMQGAAAGGRYGGSVRGRATIPPTSAAAG